MNLGLKDSLRKAFSHEIISIPRSEIKNPSVPHGMWMAGFMSGEGCFFVHARPNIRKISIFIKIAQDKRDDKLIESFVEYFGEGRCYKPLNEKMCYYICEKLSAILDNIIPFFNKYPIEGVKADDFADFIAVANMMKMKAHLTAKGYKKILLIKGGMNKKRKLK